MGIFGIMRTGVSGMAAQASKLSAAGDNIANVNTAGYKRASTEFASFISGNGGGEYNSGGVSTFTRYAISDEGVAQGTSNPTDLAIRGKGFFIVSDAGGTPYMTRAGGFVKDGNNNLINTAGFYLMGYPINNGRTDVISNSLDGLQRINLAGMSYDATPTTSGTLEGNLDFNADVVAGNTPANNAANSEYTAKTSIVTYDQVGNKVFLDVYMTKTADADPAAAPPVEATWEVSVFNKADADATTGGFPYGTAGDPPLSTFNLTFDATGKLSTPGTTQNITLPDGNVLALDYSQTFQTAAETDLRLDVDGNAASAVEDVEIASDGTVYALFDDGSRMATYRIPLATVASPDQLTPESGNVYSVSNMSGDVRVGFPESSGFGSIQDKALEQSNVDLASELTSMIESQRSYTANSKVFQTGSELLDVLVNLKR